MKKGLIVFFLACMFVLTLSISAYANNGPHRGGAAPGATDGGFAQDTDGCAGCHRAHTGVQAKLLMSGSNVYSFCSACHDGTGANTNVLQGLFEGDQSIAYEGVDSQGHGVANRGLNAGGFLQAVGYTGRENRNPGVGDTNRGSVTSRHNLEGLDGSGPFTAFGGGSSGYDNSGSGPITGTLTGGSVLTLKCTSCHDPHGSKNADGSERYRILNTKITNYDGATTPVDISGVKIQSQETGSVKDYTKIQYKKNADGSSGISSFCGACHTQYRTGMSVYNANDTQGNVTRYRHPIDSALSTGDLKTGNSKTIAENLTAHTELPVEQDAYGAISGTDKMVCLSCHQAHGTYASVSPTASVAPANSSTLLRLNNRGVCQDCHQR